jgi:6-pyruvoyltetrahydropterin/6-carboxytetrahydropterin synthase
MITETFKEFTFEAAHQIPPHSGLHGHSFKVVVFLQGEPDPVFGWSHNLYDVESAIDQVKNQLDHKYLNAIDGLEVPSLENLARWLWHELDTKLVGVDRVVVSRGFDGSAEGCTCSRRVAEQMRSQADRLAAHAAAVQS